MTYQLKKCKEHEVCQGGGYPEMNKYQFHRKPISDYPNETPNLFVVDPVTGTPDKTQLAGKKCIVTERALDDWRAQLYGVKVNNLPNSKP
jgi:hypothetical protein